MLGIIFVFVSEKEENKKEYRPIYQILKSQNIKISIGLKNPISVGLWSIKCHKTVWNARYNSPKPQKCHQITVKQKTTVRNILFFLEKWLNRLIKIFACWTTILNPSPGSTQVLFSSKNVTALHLSDSCSYFTDENEDFKEYNILGKFRVLLCK